RSPEPSMRASKRGTTPAWLELRRDLRDDLGRAQHGLAIDIEVRDRTHALGPGRAEQDAFLARELHDGARRTALEVDHHDVGLDSREVDPDARRVAERLRQRLGIGV